MSILAYIFIAVLWMTSVWLISVWFANKWKDLTHNPSFWLFVIGVGVLSPICAQIYSVLVYGIFNLVPGFSMETHFQSVSENISKQTTVLGFQAIIKIAFFTYALGVAIFIFRVVRSWSKLSRGANRKPDFQYQAPIGKIDVILTDLNIPPCSFGVRRFVILMPSALHADLTTQQAHLVYAHEAAHISARDPLIMLGILILRAFYWPHPCLHDLFRRWQLAAELRADTTALIGTTPFLRKIYGQLLVNVLRSNSRGALPCPSASLNLSNYRSAKMRVINIMNPKSDTGKPKRYRKITAFGSGLFFLVSVIGISAVAGEAISADQNAQPVQRIAPMMPKDCPINEGKYAAKIKLKFNVSKSGHVEHVRITNSDNACFNQASINAVLKWKYATNTRKLKNVETMMAFMVSDD